MEIRLASSIADLTSDVKSMIKIIVQAQSDLPYFADNAAEVVAGLFEKFDTDTGTALGNQTETVAVSLAPDLESIKVRLAALLRQLDQATASAADMAAKRKNEARNLLG